MYRTEVERASFLELRTGEQNRWKHFNPDTGKANGGTAVLFCRRAGAANRSTSLWRNYQGSHFFRVRPTKKSLSDRGESCASALNQEDLAARGGGFGHARALLRGGQTDRRGLPGPPLPPCEGWPLGQPRTLFRLNLILVRLAVRLIGRLLRAVFRALHRAARRVGGLAIGLLRPTFCRVINLLRSAFG